MRAEVTWPPLPSRSPPCVPLSSFDLHLGTLALARAAGTAYDRLRAPPAERNPTRVHLGRQTGWNNWTDWGRQSMSCRVPNLVRRPVRLIAIHDPAVI